MFSAVTISLVPEAKGGPFVFWDDLASGCRQAAELGYDAVEVFPRSAEELDVHELKRCLNEYKLKLASMGTGAGWIVQRLRLTDPMPAQRRRAREFIESIVDLAGSFGAPAVVGSMQGRWDAPTTREQSLAWLAEAIEQLAPRAFAHGVPLLLEPLNRYEANLLNRVADVLLFLQGLRTQNVKILCDLFHMNIEEKNIADALRLAATRLGHVHLADSNRQAAGFGHIDFSPISAVLKEIAYQGGVSGEIFPLPDSLAAATQTISMYRKLFLNKTS